jgi:hypothetical protein
MDVCEEVMKEREEEEEGKICIKWRVCSVVVVFV